MNIFFFFWGGGGEGGEGCEGRYTLLLPLVSKETLISHYFIGDRVQFNACK